MRRCEGAPARAPLHFVIDCSLGPRPAALASLAGCMRLSGIDQDAGIENCVRVECALRGAERRGEAFGTLLVVPGTMVATDGVVVGDGAAVRDDDVGGGGLDLGPLGELRTGSRGRDDRVVRRRAVG